MGSSRAQVGAKAVFPVKDVDPTMDASIGSGRKGNVMDKRRLGHGLGIAAAVIAAAALVAVVAWAGWMLFLDVFWDSVEL